MKKNQTINNKVWISGATKPSEVVNVSKAANMLLWLVAFIILAVGVAFTLYIGGGAYNSSIAVLVVLVALGVARFTNQGRRFWAFFNASKLELAKVVWPTRKETMTISAMVIVACIVFSIFISIFGLLFEKFIQFFLS